MLTDLLEMIRWAGMKLSVRGEYALRALLVLGLHYGEGVVRIQTISEQQNIPKKFLEQILLSLKTFGLVASKKGKGGGYMLVQPPEQITLALVIRMIDGPIAPLPCASETRFKKCEECADIETCGTRIVMKEVRDAMAPILERTTLAAVCRKVDAARKKPREPEALVYNI